MTSSDYTKNDTTSVISRIEALYDRLVRARTLVADNHVFPVYGVDDQYIVQGNGGMYLINTQDNCRCPDSVNRPELKGNCKHKLAVAVYLEQLALEQTLKMAKTKETTRAKTESQGDDPAAILYT